MSVMRDIHQIEIQRAIAELKFAKYQKELRETPGISVVHDAVITHTREAGEALRGLMAKYFGGGPK